MNLKIKKRLWVKPRICPECKKVCILAENYASIRCQKCHRHRKHIKNRAKAKAKFGNRKGKYNQSYISAKRRLIEKHPYCALCGSTGNLTAHHIGGGCRNDRLTVLCCDCHQAYEKWNLKRKVSKWYQAIKRTVPSVIK